MIDMTGILIDPFLKKLTNVNVRTENTLQDMYKHIGCSMVEVVSFGDVNDLWVDEEGLLKRDQRFFKVSDLPIISAILNNEGPPPVPVIVNLRAIIATPNPSSFSSKYLLNRSSIISALNSSCIDSKTCIKSSII